MSMQSLASLSQHCVQTEQLHCYLRKPQAMPQEAMKGSNEMQLACARQTTAQTSCLWKCLPLLMLKLCTNLCCWNSMPTCVGIPLRYTSLYAEFVAAKATDTTHCMCIPQNPSLMTRGVVAISRVIVSS